jgi:hypothetical protein
MPGYYRSGNVSKIDTDIGRTTPIPLRVLIKLVFTVVRAELTLLIFVHARETSTIIFNNCKTDRIGSHDVHPCPTTGIVVVSFRFIFSW